MTQPEAVEEFHHAESAEEGQEVEGIEKGQGGEAEEVAGGDIVAPQLAAIQHSYEEARACIASSRYAADDVTNPHPDTEKIDLRLVKSPAVQEATTPPTRAMSVAARHLAESPVTDGRRSRAEADGSRQQGHTASCPSEDETQAPHLHTDLPVVTHPSRRWWRAIRSTLPGTVPLPR